MATSDLINFIAALTISALLLAWLWQRRRSGRGGARKPPAESLDTVQSWTPQAVRVLTLPERQAYDLVRKALPGRLVLAQVPLARFISVPTRHSYSDWLTRVGRLTVDLLVCDKSSRVVAVVDVRTAGQSPRSTRRHDRMTQVLETAGIRVLHWNADALPSASEVRALFRDQGALAEEEEFIGPGGRRMLPVPEMVEVLAEGDEAAMAGPQFDPVSSDYFDDLDALTPRSAGRG
ncbi:DUF2726 domain-containing protein [Variovorax sp. YR752]|uniref:DUF2726 domain-containing protein n=1 Tax=Variovorax sp. YR752 TaxID=1884383 RepID=UPI0031377682